MPKIPNPAKAGARTEPAQQNKPTRNQPKPNKSGRLGNVKQNTTNKGYQQDR